MKAHTKRVLHSIALHINLSKMTTEDIIQELEWVFQNGYENGQVDKEIEVLNENNR
jgi:hypothetical protein